jgi:hypothetical protein
MGSVARSVTTWVPTIKSFRLNDVPIPRPPWMLDDQNMLMPPSGPVSGSIAVAENSTFVPGRKESPSEGESMVTTGG